MPLDIVYEYPAPAGWLRRFIGALVPLFGGLLIFVGLVASSIAILCLLGIIAAIGSDKPDALAPVAALVVSTLVAVASFIGGFWLIRGKRRLVLFLRKFGFTGATQAVTFAVVKALGQNWRLVTLDDAEVAPVGTRKRMRWLAIVAGLIGVVVIAWGLFWVFGGSFDTLMGNTAKGAMKGATLQNFLGKIIVAMVLLIVVGAITLLFILVSVSFAGAVAIFAWSSYGAIRRAESAKTVPIATEAQLEQTALAIAERSRRIIGPRLVVAKVTSSIWQPTVRRLASASSAVIIDISEPTDSLLWEIETLRQEMRSRCILVGEQDRVRRMTEGAAQPGSSPQARLLRLLDGEQVLAYPSDKPDLRRFARSLHARLEALPAA